MCALLMWATSNQVPGTALSRPRATMFFQNQPLSRSNRFMMSNQLMKMPENTGSMIAHRNGLLFDQAEHSSSQPTVGSAHSAYTGIVASIEPASCSGLPGPQTRVIGLPLCSSTNVLSSSRKPNMQAIATPTAISGATSSALAALDSTVSRSETGSDFQNSTLRSLRSSYRLPRQ